MLRVSYPQFCASLMHRERERPIPSFVSGNT
jgi:hypothetical protein